LLEQAQPGLLSNCLNKPQPAVCEECLRQARNQVQGLVPR